MTISFFLHSYKDRKGYRRVYLKYSHMTSETIKPYLSVVKDEYGKPLKCKESEWIDLKTFALGPKKGGFSAKDRPYRVRLSAPFAIEKNRILDNLEEHILREVVPKLHLKGQAPTVKNIASSLKAGEKNITSVEDMLDGFLEHRKRMGKSRPTILNTKSAISFFRRYGLENIQAFSPNLYEDIKEYALYEGLSENSFRAYVAILKHFLKYAFKNGYVDPFSLDGWSTGAIRTEQAALRIEDIGTLYKGKLSGIHDLAKEYLLIFCMTGLRYSELLSHSSDMINKEERVIAVRKGKSMNGAQLTHRVRLNPVAYHIFKKYEFELPRPNIVLRPHYFNPKIREACKLLGIDYTVVLNGKALPISQEISTHTGRRTLVSTACTDFNMEYGKVRTITGHSQIGDMVQLYNQRKNEEIGFMTMDLYYKQLQNALSFLPKSQ